MSFPLTREPSALPEQKYEGSVGATAKLLCAQRCNFYGGLLENNHTAEVFIQFFDAAATGDVTVGTTTPVFTLGIPASGKIVLDHMKPWHHFPTGIVYAVTSTRTGSGSPGANATTKLYFSAQ